MMKHIEFPKNPRDLIGTLLTGATGGMLIPVVVRDVYLDPLESDPPRIYVEPVFGEGVMQMPRTALFPRETKATREETEPDRDDAAREISEALGLLPDFSDVLWNEANAVYFTRREDGQHYRLLVESGFEP
jgi:hypothetical protein